MKNIESLDPSKFNIQEVKEKKEEMEANLNLMSDTTKTKQQRHEDNKVLTNIFKSELFIIIIRNLKKKKKRRTKLILLSHTYVMFMKTLNYTIKSNILFAMK